MVEYFKDRFDLLHALKHKISHTDCVLDLGAGIRPMDLFRPKLHIAVELWPDYVAVLKDKYKNDPGFILLQGSAQDILPFLTDKMVDSVFMLDFIEHLSKEDGKKLLTEACRLARAQIVVFTPLGFLPQQVEEDGADGWGFKGNINQSHVSAWLPEDFGPGWDCLICENFFMVDHKNRPLPKPAGAIWAIFNQPAKHDAPPEGAIQDSWRPPAPSEDLLNKAQLSLQYSFLTLSQTANEITNIWKLTEKMQPGAAPIPVGNLRIRLNEMGAKMNFLFDQLTTLQEVITQLRPK